MLPPPFGKCKAYDTHKGKKLACGRRADYDARLTGLMRASSHSTTQRQSMRVLGIETSCDETGVAIYDSERGLLADALFSQIDLHRVYGGVVPELASRDHVKRLVPLMREVFDQAALQPGEVDGVVYTAGPGWGAISRWRLCACTGLCLGRAGAGRASHGRSSVGPHAGSVSSCVPFCRAAGVGWSYPTGPGGRHW